eukprot:TRINITY_DN16112_c1_g1_i1.p1 TRINITY_DN16112_c1_g1~~TRINITY_DN16112_c1_g1_i1.p1  ORF type:complete len:132 (+),score=23.50 TRINITY_DN16112_c1_g1_i1:117-512(+)
MLVATDRPRLVMLDGGAAVTSIMWTPSCVAHDQSSSGEIWSRHIFQQFLKRCIGVMNQHRKHIHLATNIPPHNLGELVDVLSVLIHNPDATLQELLEYMPGPDFPTGGLIMGNTGWCPHDRSDCSPSIQHH